MKEIGIEDARRQLGDIVNRAQYRGEDTMITRNGKPAAFIVPVSWYASVNPDLADDGTPNCARCGALAAEHPFPDCEEWLSSYMPHVPDPRKTRQANGKTTPAEGNGQ